MNVYKQFELTLTIFSYFRNIEKTDLSRNTFLRYTCIILSSYGYSNVFRIFPTFDIPEMLFRIEREMSFNFNFPPSVIFRSIANEKRGEKKVKKSI